MRNTFLRRNRVTTLSAAAFGVLASLMLPTAASAALVSGAATITIDNGAFAQASKSVTYPNGWIVQTHWGAADNQLAIGSATTGGTTLPASGSSAMIFPVNSNTATINHPAAGLYGRTEQATTMDAADTSVGQIGLSGAWRLSAQPGTLTPYDFSLVKTAGTWNLRSYDAAFSTQNFLKLANVSETLDASGRLLLSADLQWTGLWGVMVGANTNAVVGHISLAPAAVPVPGAVWLLGSGLACLIGASRKARVARA